MKVHMGVYPIFRVLEVCSMGTTEEVSWGVCVCVCVHVQVPFFLQEIKMGKYNIF